MKTNKKNCLDCYWYWDSPYGTKCHNEYVLKLQDNNKPDKYNCEFFDDKLEYSLQKDIEREESNALGNITNSTGD